MVSSNNQKYNHGYINVNVINTPKTEFFSQYTMGKFLGQGGFGTVCVGVQKTTNVKRAIKMVSKVTLTEKDRIILLEELALLKQIDHPNILKILEHYEDDQHHFFVTELLSGGELFNKIMELNGFDEKQASSYMRQILSAVSYCHSQNIVHRDLKPENILFTSKKSNQIKVIDFGCSTKFDQNKKIKDVAGTVLYLAPEVIKKSLYDEKCDIWSLGVVMYIMLCGYPPFDGLTDEEVFNEIQNNPVSFEGKEWEKISDEAKDLIQKMLQKDPNQRISAALAYQHPWIQKRIKNTNIQENLMKNLAQFSARNKIKTALLNMITLHILKNKEKQQIIQNFQQLDKNGDGQLSKEELIEGYERLIGDRSQAERIVELVFKEIDYDGSGQVSFQEFLVATANKEEILSKENLVKAFDLIDEDRNGFITRDELEKVVGGTSLNDQVWEQMMKECDVNGDGKIDKTEFVDLIFKWLEKDLFKAKGEYLSADDKYQHKRKGSAPLISQQTSPSRYNNFNSLSQFDNRFNYKSKVQNNLKKSLDIQSKQLNGLSNGATANKGPSYQLYNNYYNQNNFYSTHKSMIKSQAASNNNSNRASYMTQSVGAMKFMKTSGNRSIQMNGNETESIVSGYPNNFDSMQSQQLNQELNSLSHLPQVKSPKQQSPNKKINTIATIKTFNPTNSINSSLN